MSGILINVISKPVKQHHICFFTKQDGNDIILYEVVDRFYEHPDSKGMALIQRIEIDRIDTVRRGSIEAAPLKLLEYTNNNIFQLRQYGG